MEREGGGEWRGSEANALTNALQNHTVVEIYEKKNPQLFNTEETSTLSGGLILVKTYIKYKDQNSLRRN